MPQRLSLMVDDEWANQIESLAREYELPEQEVLRQIITIGLEEIENKEF